ncbi:MAG: TraR/DksA family transcriptional regulator [Candidatus Anammoxibacter sp.]
MASDLKKILKEQHDKLTEKRDELLSIINDRLKTTQSEDNTKFTDIADIATHNSEEELAMRVASKEIKMLKQIEEALLRINSKKYGICITCNSDINIDRLKALPFSILCVQCKEKEESEDYDGNEDYGYGSETEFNSDFSIDEDEDNIKPNEHETNKKE